MERIYSRIEPERLLHIVFRDAEIGSSLDQADHRTRIAPSDQGLQVAHLNMKNGHTFRPHFHLIRPREIQRTQETWVVISGTVLVSYYDIDGQMIERRLLLPGDVTVTLEGGHNYLACEDDTRVVEVKLGPFVGVTADKDYLDKEAVA